MSNVVYPSTFVEREIEAKVERGIKALIDSGVKPADISDKHIEDIARKAWGELTDAAKFQCGQEGLMLMARQVIGERIAEKIWELGKGWPTTENAVVAIAESLGIDGEEAIGCLSDYREAANKTTGESLDVFRSLGRFAPLFLGQPKGTTIGEVATRKAASGDKLAMSFIAWRAVE